MAAVELFVSVIVGILSIIVFTYSFKNWFFERIWSAKPSGAYINNGNVHLVYPSGITKQITFVNSDISPVLARSCVVFFREEKVGFDKPYSRFRLMSVSSRTLKETIVSDQKPFSDGLNGSYEILNPGNPSLSPDQSKVVFTIEKYVTGSQLVQVDLKTGKWTELFSVEHLEVIRSGSYKNKLLVGRSEVGDKGRDVYYKVCDHDGRVLLDFNSYDEYMKFRSTALTRE